MRLRFGMLTVLTNIRSTKIEIEFVAMEKSIWHTFTEKITFLSKDN